MSDTKYPLCEQAMPGKRILSSVDGESFVQCYLARDVEALLQSAPVVYGKPGETLGPKQASSDTHSARLLLIEPLAPPEPEEIALLREFVAEFNAPYVDRKSFHPRLTKLTEMTKAFLNSRDKKGGSND